MKFTFEAEDAVVGILCGILLLGFVGKFFSLKLNNYFYAVAFAAFIFFIFLDIIYGFSDLSSSFVLIILSFLHNLVDLTISLAFISYFTEIDIPYITSIVVPYLQNEQIIAGIGIFLIVGNAIWLMTLPFWT